MQLRVFDAYLPLTIPLGLPLLEASESLRVSCVAYELLVTQPVTSGMLLLGHGK
jgi:hypothetical protein